MRSVAVAKTVAGWLLMVDGLMCIIGAFSPALYPPLWRLYEFLTAGRRPLGLFVEAAFLFGVSQMLLGAHLGLNGPRWLLVWLRATIIVMAVFLLMSILL